MWRYFVGAGAGLLLVVAGVFLGRGSSAPVTAVAAPSPAPEAVEQDGLPAEAPRASDKTREQKRFDRYDKDKNDAITREEYLLSRNKAFAKLDTNKDGKLGFEEWAIKTTGKFAGADKDKSGALTRAEFLTTAPKPSKKKATPKCACPKPSATAPAEDGEDQ